MSALPDTPTSEEGAAVPQRCLLCGWNEARVEGYVCERCVEVYGPATITAYLAGYRDGLRCSRQQAALTRCS
jgi:hypothetical protein